jgi:hypothetical protein
MARKYTTTDRRAAQGRQEFPLVPYERVHDPIGEHAIDQPGVSRTLLRRGIRALRWAGIGLVLLIPTIAATVIWPDMPGGAGFAVFAVMVVGAYMLVYSVFRTIGVMRLWTTMRRHPWRVFSCQLPARRIEGSLVLVLTHKKESYAVRTPGTEHTQAIWRMPRPEVWFVGDPHGRGVLTPAGGPELFITHPTRSAKVANRAVRKPKRTGPGPFRALFPKRPPSAAALQRRAARADRRKAADQARRQKFAERAKARQAKAAARRAANPPKPRKPARQPTPQKQPGLGSRLRQGRRVNWMK